jgi:hypothetical protein
MVTERLDVGDLLGELERRRTGPTTIGEHRS